MQLETSRCYVNQLDSVCLTVITRKGFYLAYTLMKFSLLVGRLGDELIHHVTNQISARRICVKSEDVEDSRFVLNSCTCLPKYTMSHFTGHLWGPNHTLCTTGHTLCPVDTILAHFVTMHIVTTYFPKCVSKILFSTAFFSRWSLFQVILYDKQCTWLKFSLILLWRVDVSVCREMVRGAVSVETSRSADSDVCTGSATNNSSTVSSLTMIVVLILPLMSWRLCDVCFFFKFTFQTATVTTNKSLWLQREAEHCQLRCQTGFSSRRCCT
jgi:hypothetical protein